MQPQQYGVKWDPMYIIGDPTSVYRQSSLRSVHDVYMKDLHLDKHSLSSSSKLGIK